MILSSSCYCKGDNLHVMRDMPDNLIDLIATDPPYNSGRDFVAFSDIWDSPCTDNSTKKIRDIARFVKDVHSYSMANYISFLGVRMIEMHRILEKTGSIYLQCDDSSVHYIKMLMDSVFGKNNFRNEIIWHRYDSAKGTKGKSRKFPRNNDRILMYSKSNKYYFNPLYHPVIDEDTKRYSKNDNDGRGFYTTGTLENPKPGGYMYDYKGYATPKLGYRCPIETMIAYDNLGYLHYPKKKSSQITKKRFLHDFKGKQIDDNWTDIKGMYAAASERIGYPTQKPIDLYKRIISSGCPVNGSVMDPFAGSGTTCIAAHSLGHNFVGIDLLKEHEDKIRDRFKREYNKDFEFTEME